MANLTISEWARFFGVTERQARQWAQDTRLSNVSSAPPKPNSQPIVFIRKQRDEIKKEK